MADFFCIHRHQQHALNKLPPMCLTEKSVCRTGRMALCVAKDYRDEFVKIGAVIVLFAAMLILL